RRQQRLDHAGLDELLRARPRERPRTRALARVRPDGMAAPGDHAGKARHPARRREERAAAELREPALWARLRDAPRRALPAGPPVPLAGHRLDGGPGRGDARGRARVLPRALRAEQRLARRRRLGGARRRVHEATVQPPRLYLAWHSPAYLEPGDAELDTAAAVLADGKASRLPRLLVYERRIAQSVQAFQQSGRFGSTFMIVVTGRPGSSLAELERLVRSELESVARSGVEQRELDRARNRIETAFFDELQSVADRADRLNLYAYYADDPGYVARDLERYRRLTPALMQRAVERHLLDSPGVVLSVIPHGRAELAAMEAA